MKKYELFNRIVAHTITGYLLVAAIVLTGLHTNRLISDLANERSWLAETSIQTSKQEPADIFFKDTLSEFDEVNLIDNSFSLARLSTFDYDLADQERNTKARLLVYIDDLDALTFEGKVTDVLRLAQSTQTSLLAINFSLAEANLHLAPDVGTKFTDAEAEQFVQTSVIPALQQNRLEFAIASTIEKFQLEVTGENFYTPSDLQFYQLSTATAGTAKEDYLLDYAYLQKDINEAETKVAIYSIILVLMLALAFYHLWLTPDRLWGMLFGLAVGPIGYIIIRNFSDQESYFTYSELLVPLVVAAVIGSLVGLLLDYVLSRPDLRGKSARPVRRKK